MIAVYKLTNQ